MGRGEKARSDLATTTLTCLNSNLSTSIDKVSEKDEEREKEGEENRRHACPSARR